MENADNLIGNESNITNNTNVTIMEYMSFSRTSW